MGWRAPRTVRRLTRILTANLLLLVLLVAWELAARADWLAAGFVPGPASVVAVLAELVESGELWRDASASVWRVLMGFALGSSLALLLGLVMGSVPALARQIRTIVDVVRPIPPLAWIPLAILWFGIGDRSAIFIVAVGAFFPMAVSCFDAVVAARAQYLNLARSLGLRRTGLLLRVLLPAALPQIGTGIRISIGIAWTSVIAAELVSGQSGLGYLIQESRLLLRMDKVLCGMMMIGLIGFALSRAASLLERRLLRWTETS